MLTYIEKSTVENVTNQDIETLHNLVRKVKQNQKVGINYMKAWEREDFMENNYLIVVDMQKDFVDGALGTPEAVQIVPSVAQKVRDFKGKVIFTKDTHTEDYMSTQEGKHLPVPHCIKGTDGWELTDALDVLQKEYNLPVYEKTTFGCSALASHLLNEHEKQPITSIELIGLCTDICVVSNALILKAFLPEVEIRVDASCCAGVTPAAHDAALATMRSCQIQITD